jgi:hypothetical protein
LRVTRALVYQGRLGAALELIEHRSDSLGIPLDPMRFTPTDALAQLENWDLSAGTLMAVRR